MKWTSVLAIYFLVWVFSAFLLLPFGVKTSDELGETKVPGQADSAPHRFDLRLHLLKAAALAVILTAIYVANYAFGWVSVDLLDLYN